MDQDSNAHRLLTRTDPPLRSAWAHMRQPQGRRGNARREGWPAMDKNKMHAAKLGPHHTTPHAGMHLSRCGTLHLAPAAHCNGLGVGSIRWRRGVPCWPFDSYSTFVSVSNSSRQTLRLSGRFFNKKRFCENSINQSEYKTILSLATGGI